MSIRTGEKCYIPYRDPMLLNYQSHSLVSLVHFLLASFSSLSADEAEFASLLLPAALTAAAAALVVSVLVLYEDCD